MREQPRRRSAATIAESSARSRLNSRGWLASVALRYAPGTWSSGTGFVGAHRDPPGLQQVEDLPLLLQHRLLLLEHLELLHVDRVERGERDVVGLGTRILAGGDDVLADDDDRQQDKLEEGLAEPRDTDEGVAVKEGLHGLRKRDERDQDEQVRGPHRPARPGDVHRQPAVETTEGARAVDGRGHRPRG